MNGLLFIFALTALTITAAPAQTENRALVEHIKRTKKFDPQAVFGRDVETVSLVGKYEIVNDVVRRYRDRGAPHCGGTPTDFDRTIPSIVVLTPKRCRVVEVPYSEFVAEHEHGAECYQVGGGMTFVLREVEGFNLLTRER